MCVILPSLQSDFETLHPMYDPFTQLIESVCKVRHRQKLNYLSIPFNLKISDRMGIQLTFRVF